MLAGVRFIARDRLLASLAVTSLFLNAFGQMLIAALPVLAFQQFDESARIAGAFFAAFGAGAVLGSVIAVKLVHRFEPIRLGAVSLIALTLPIWILPLGLPAPGVMAALFVSSVFGPLVNAPLIGVITMRTPEALRPKVMTAVLTFAMLAGPGRPARGRPPARWRRCLQGVPGHRGGRVAGRALLRVRGVPRTARRPRWRAGQRPNAGDLGGSVASRRPAKRAL